ncbi:MAG TPA: zinc-ribbon domain-containing protein [Kofleriaceae bacterium]|jgi:predicted Zn finger-like uncharacterized protein|nr:zinc-ribbon domain-containing protein [Kofleriaceae bacterium]
MDVRCEKCQTEYELDEARLKPGGVTVKCTNCGHMFKIRKRTITNVGVTSPPGSSGSSGSSVPGPGTTMPSGLVGHGAASSRARTSSSKPLPAPVNRPRGDSMLDDDARPTIVTGPDEAPTTVDRQWLIRLENGEQKSCRELATLQQWIVSGVVTRESLISRTGKTWKRIGDIADLDQYFAIADEARATRDRARPVSRPGPIASVKEIPGTIPGYSAAQAAGGTILPDDDEPGEARTTRAYPQGRAMVNTPPPVPTRGAARTPAVPVHHVPPAPPPAHGPGAPGVPPAPSAARGGALAPTELAAPPRTPQVTPPVPPRRPAAASGPAAHPPVIPPLPPSNRATAMWATDGVKPEMPSAAVSGPFVGKIAMIPDEPAFAGRVRITPGDPAAFEPGRARALDDDDDVLPARRGSRAGMWVLIMALLVMGAAAAVVYLFVLRTGSDEQAARPAKDAGATAVAPVPDAAAVVAQVPAAPDAAAVEASPLAGPRGELAADVEPRLRTAAHGLDGKPDAASQALRAHLIAQLAQDLLDRAGLIASPDADNLRKESRQLVLDAATAAQHALRAAPDDPGANLAMAEVLRLQAKPARDIKRYLDTARARPDPSWATDLALADAMVLARDGKVEEARAAFAAIDQGGGKLETSGDVRARFHLALALAAQGKAAEARPLVEAILAAQPEHTGAKALAGKLETLVTRTDPLPPEDRENGGAGTVKNGPGTPGTPGTPRPAGTTGSPGPRPGPAAPGPSAEPAGGDSYDRLLQRANAISDSNCAKAMDLYARALELKPNGVEALAGLGFCQIDAKQFSSAFSKFRAALAVSPKFEPALRGIAETYTQQGRKEQAIEAYRRYLEVYPDNAAAKKQLERLGADTQAAPPSPPAPSGSGGAPASPPASAPAPAPAPAAPPPPAPAPASDSSGSGSGSG